MVSNDYLFENLQGSPIQNAIKVLERMRTIFDYVTYIPGKDFVPKDSHDTLLELFSIIQVYLDEFNLSSTNIDFGITGDSKENSQNIIFYLSDVRLNLLEQKNKEHLLSFKTHYANKLGSGFSYEFSQSELDRIQTLINELRESIKSCIDLEENHKARLQKRLEVLQKELHKKLSDLDRFWGLVGDAGVVIGKLGNDAKPIVDRIREISEIIWKSQKTAENLPTETPSPLLNQNIENSN